MKKLILALPATALLLSSSAFSQTLTVYYDFEGTGADRFDDPAGAFADDLIGQYNPAFSSDVAAATGGTQSASFNGDSALFTDAFTTDLGPDPNAFTIMFWIKARDVDQENNNTRLLTSRVRPDGTATTGSSWQVEGFGDPDNLNGDPNDDGTQGDRMDVRYQPFNAVYPQNWFSPDATNALATQSQGEFTAEWRHVAFVLSNSGDPGDGGAYGQTYVDGVSVGLAGMHIDWDNHNLANLEGQLILGGNAENAGTRAFTGLLDDFALFAGIVSAQDIADIASGAKSPADFLVSFDPADLDQDGDVDDADFGIAFAAFTGPGGVSTSPADLDGDGDVDDADFGIAFAAFTGPGGGAGVVPEPASLALLGLGGLMIARRRRD